MSLWREPDWSTPTNRASEYFNDVQKLVGCVEQFGTTWLATYVVDVDVIKMRCINKYLGVFLSKEAAQIALERLRR